MKAAPRLTTLSHGSGCACKIGPGDLAGIIHALPRADDPNLLVGFETADDAGVYRVSDDLALVQSVDFFTPILDDPYDFGRVAAANALSDIYAMGARPLTALNLIAFSLEELGGDVLVAILLGGSDIAASAGVAVIGGHSIDDPEPKFGMAVTGVAHPDRVVRNSGGSAGDALFLTKPVGGGAITTAAKRGHAPQDTLARCTEVMTTLNGPAAQAALSVGPSAMTDVTGFGLVGHLAELAEASAVAARVEVEAVPVIEGAFELVVQGEATSGGSRRNREFREGQTRIASSLRPERVALMFDAMTSGGLLIATPSERADEMEAALMGAAPQTKRIGDLLEGEPGNIELG